MKDILRNLLKIKSIITILLTLVFCVMLICSIFMEVEIPQEFVLIYTTVIGFYFGTQFKKGEDINNESLRRVQRTNT